MSLFAIKKSEFDRVYAEQNPSVFTAGGNQTAEKKYNVVPVSESETSVLIVTDGDLKDVQKDYPSATATKQTALKYPRSYNGSISAAEKFLTDNAKKAPQVETKAEQTQPAKDNSAK